MLHKELAEEGGEGGAGDGGGDGGDVGRKGAVGVDGSGEGADDFVGAAGFDAGAERREQVDALRGGEKFDGENVAEIGEHRSEAARGAHAHGDVIFLVRGRGNGIDGVRRGERFHFAGERGGGHLQDHEAGVESGMADEKSGQVARLRIGHLVDAALGNASESGESDGEMVGGHGERLAVEIAAAENVAGISENEGIVGGAVEFDGERGADVGESIARGAVNLRDAAEAVGVLHARVFCRRAVRFADLAAAVEALEMAGDESVAGMRARIGDARIEGDRAAAKRVERERGGDVSRIGGNFGVAQGESEKSEHGLGAVEEREAFLGVQHERVDSRCAKGFGAGHAAAFENGFAFADGDEREMRERREIAGSADGALRRDDGKNITIEHGEERIGDDRSDAGKALGQGVGAKSEHGARGGRAERFADAAGVAANEIELQVADFVVGNTRGGEFAEAGVDAVDGGFRFDEAFDDGARSGHAFTCRSGNFGLEFAGIEDQVVEIFQGERVAVDDDGGHGFILPAVTSLAMRSLRAVPNLSFAHAGGYTANPKARKLLETKSRFPYCVVACTQVAYSCCLRYGLVQRFSSCRGGARMETTQIGEEVGSGEKHVQVRWSDSRRKP